MAAHPQQTFSLEYVVLTQLMMTLIGLAQTGGGLQQLKSILLYGPAVWPYRYSPPGTAFWYSPPGTALLIQPF